MTPTKRTNPYGQALTKAEWEAAQALKDRPLTDGPIQPHNKSRDQQREPKRIESVPKKKSARRQAEWRAIQTEWRRILDAAEQEAEL